MAEKRCADGHDGDGLIGRKRHKKDEGDQRDPGQQRHDEQGSSAVRRLGRRYCGFGCRVEEGGQSLNNSNRDASTAREPRCARLALRSA